MNEAWKIFMENEGYNDPPCRCHDCGNLASGDVTRWEGGNEVVICDNPDNCPENYI